MKCGGVGGWLGWGGVGWGGVGWGGVGWGGVGWGGVGWGGVGWGGVGWGAGGGVTACGGFEDPLHHQHQPQTPEPAPKQSEHEQLLCSWLRFLLASVSVFAAVYPKPAIHRKDRVNIGREKEAQRG